MMRSMMACLFSFLLVGCAAAVAEPTVSDFDLAEYRAAVAISAAQLDKPDDLTPTPKPPRKDCKVCNGTGKVRSGDGLHIFDCSACEAPASVNLPETPDGSNGQSSLDGSDDEVAFGEPLRELPELASKRAAAERTLRTEKLCDCEKTGLCDCGTDCDCYGVRIRVAFLYTMENCPACVVAKAKIIEAAASGQLPANMRVVIKPAPDWVRSFPTFHFEADETWHKTNSPAVFLRHCNRINDDPVTVIMSTPVYYGSACGAGGCSSGSCYGGSCSSGSCGAGSFYSGGWSSGGGCSSGSCGGGFRSFRGSFRSFGGFRGGCSSCGG